MATDIVAAERVEHLSFSQVPEGIHHGVWGGYRVNVIIDGKQYRFTTKDGVRGMNIPCKVTVVGGRISVETDGRS